MPFASDHWPSPSPLTKISVSAIIALLSFVPCLQAGQELDLVTGTGCYQYGDDQTPALANRAALALAQEQAVRNHHVYIESSAKVKNFQLEEDVVNTASSGMLEHIRVDRQVAKGQEICITITAKLSPIKLDKMIEQKTKAKVIAEAAQKPVLADGSDFALKLWTNKQPGKPFVEGESLEISVQSNRDAFLKVDYYQADGAVVHLVPNMFVDDAFVQAGKTYTFGGKHSRSGFRIVGPFGAETIKAIASTYPLDSTLTSRETFEESQTYLNDFHTAMRGIKLTSNAKHIAQWAEAAFGLITVSQASFQISGIFPHGQKTQ